MTVKDINLVLEVVHLTLISNSGNAFQQVLQMSCTQWEREVCSSSQTCFSTNAHNAQCSYLTNSSHVTRVADSCSSLGFPHAGVPQGSILGHTLFSSFINDLPSVLPANSTVLFADDTTIFIVSDSLFTLESSLQISLDLANLWLVRNGLKMNTSQTTPPSTFLVSAPVSSSSLCQVLHSSLF